MFTVPDTDRPLVGAAVAVVNPIAALPATCNFEVGKINEVIIVPVPKFPTVTLPFSATNKFGV